MRIAVGMLTSATTLFIAGAFGLLGPWALAAATVLGLIGAMWTVTVLEERDNAMTIASALTDRRHGIATPIDDLWRRSV